MSFLFYNEIDNLRKLNNLGINNFDMKLVGGKHTMNGEQLLIRFTNENFQKKMYAIAENVYFFTGFGNSNATAVIGKSSVILIDALDCDRYAKNLRKELSKITPKPVRTIIYTHTCPDHTGGAGVFSDTVQEVIAFAKAREDLKYYDRLENILNMRKIFARGYSLSDEDAITHGLGPREGFIKAGASQVPLEPTTLYTGKSVEREIDGVKFKLISMPGETKDSISVLLPEYNVLAVGDNYSNVFPNMYSVRGSSYRDVANWIEILDQILALDAETILPGHTWPLLGKEEARRSIQNYRDVLEYVLFETLRCMNDGLTLNETAEAVKLPERFKTKSLGEYFSLVEWAVKAIYTGYLGWFDGQAANLIPVPQEEYRQTMLELIGEENLRRKIKACVMQEQYQMALQLNMILHDPVLEKAALEGRAAEVANANARHFYLARAKEF